jgi:hypothetical protein
MALRPDVMDEVFATLFEAQDQVFGACCELIVQRDVPYIVFPDNITAPMIRAEDFQSYCVASYERLRAMLEERGLSRPLYCHMDGDLEPLWPDIAASPIRGLDSMSPPPDNDTPVSTALGLAPGMRVGINFPSSVHLLPGERIYDMACGFLREGAPTGRFQIQISENAPPGVWRTSLPAIMRAIEDEGALG